MWKTLIRFFTWRKLSDSPVLAPQSPTQLVEVSPDFLQEKTRITDFDLDENFIRLVLGINAFIDVKPSRFEQATLKQLDELLASASLNEKMLPRLPAVVPQLLSSLKNDDASGKYLAEQISHDPVLVGEVIRLANSPFYYQTNQKINSLQRAVIMLGQSGLKRLIANVVMKPIFNVQDGYFGHLAKNHLWSQSEYCAHACSFLAKNRYDPFDAYLAGIAVNIGMIVTVRIMDQIHKNREIPESTTFYKMISTKTKQLSAQIAENWRFPTTVLDALQDQVDIDHQPDPSSLGGVLYAANCLSQLHVLVGEECIQDDIDSLNDRLGGQLTDRHFRCYAELKRISKAATKHV